MAIFTSVQGSLYQISKRPIFAGAIGLLWSFVWMLMIHPTPEEHPTISEAEKTYIIESNAGNSQAKVP